MATRYERGRTFFLSPGRRFVRDLMSFCRNVPNVTAERRVDLSNLVAARDAADPKPGWVPIVLKAFGIAARSVPSLRTSYANFPRPRFYEHANSVAFVMVEREIDGEPVALGLRVAHVETKSLADVDAELKRAKTDPIADVPTMRRIWRLARWPYPMRVAALWFVLRASPIAREIHIGTFGASSVSSSGVALHHLQCPLTAAITFDPIASDGTTVLRLTFDHRVLDGMTAARGLLAMEAALNGPIRDELLAMSPGGAGATPRSEGPAPPGPSP